MPILHRNITNSTDIHNPKWLSTANNGDYAWKNEKGELESIDEIVLPAALNFVDASVAPPTSNNGDIYILASGGSVNAAWGSVAVGDWVKYDGALWNSITPQKSSLCYDKSADGLKFYNGLVWAGMGGGISSVTSAEKAALSPSTGDFVFDTDLNSLQRYDGAAWVDIAKGYGVCSIKDSNGIPTYYTDLQTAFNATSNIDTITIHSQIELTSAVTIPSKHKLTIDMQGNRIFGDTTSGDFNLFETVQATVLGGRYLDIIGGGIIETIGTSSNVQNACPFSMTSSNTILYWDLGTTIIKSENSQCFRALTSTLKGGYLWAENSTCFATGEIENTKFRLYETSPTDFVKVNNCDIFMIYGSWIVNQNKLFTNNVIKGTTSKSGNNGLVYGYAGSYISNNYIELKSGATKDALYIRGSGTDNHGIKNNVVFNLGTGTSGNFVYGSSYNNYFYCEGAWGLRASLSCKNVIGNTVVTNSSNRPVIDTQADYATDNTAININASHTNNPMYVGGTTNEVFNNRAICSNNSIANIKLYASGTIYLANNTMSSIGAGIDLNGNTNSMTNTPDTFGNLQIG
tara:strand:+ start:33 stop:1751 length:1719 start_codon:yes stop_codon:yes gene_type:complete